VLDAPDTRTRGDGRKARSGREVSGDRGTPPSPAEAAGSCGLDETSRADRGLARVKLATVAVEVGFELVVVEFFLATRDSAAS